MERRAVIVTDLGYGDAGKGTIVDYLAHQAPAVVVRYNGGPQAAHNVITTDGRHHTFAQFGSGSFEPGMRTHLSRFMLINPLNMALEAEHLQRLGVTDIWESLSVDEDAVIVTPWHIAANRLRELARGADRHGSTGEGVGEAKVDATRAPELAVRAKDTLNPVRLRDRLFAVRDEKRSQLQEELADPEGAEALEAWATFTDQRSIDDMVDAYCLWARRAFIVPGDYLAGLMRQAPLIVFEGAQGVLLDEWYGFQPYTTWSNTTDQNACTLLRELEYDGNITRLGVMRAYATRHGPGPFVTEDRDLTAALPDDHNNVGRWQGEFRIGHLDLLMLRYALAVNGRIDAVAVTCLDRIRDLPSWQVCDTYHFTGDLASAHRFLELDPQRFVSALKPPNYGDYAQGCELTRLLMSCEPIYQRIPVAGNPAELLHAISDSLGAPVTIVSYGPTAADKRPLATR